MKGHPNLYQDCEIQWIKAHATLPRRAAYAEFCRKFSRTDISLCAYKSLCKRNGWLTGRTGHYPTGGVPANKGKKMPFNANSAINQFKKGRLPHNTKFAGHERLHENGYVEISIEETNPHTGFERRYVLKHKYLWEKEFGKLPEGMCLKCLNGDRTNSDPSNWEPIPRGALPFLNGYRGFDYDAVSPDLKPSVLTLAKLRIKSKLLKAKAEPE